MKVTGISCAILAGGKSSRFGGKTKANAIIGGKKIIERIINVAENIFQDILIVSNNHEEFAGYSRFKITEDIFRNAGPPGGIHAALTGAESESVFIFAGDMPFIDEEIVRSQIKYFLKSDAEAVVPQIEGYPEPLHGIYRKSIIPVLNSMLQKEQGFSVADFLKKIRTDYFLLKPSNKTKKAFFNVNTPEDLARANEMTAKFDTFIDGFF